MANIILLTGPSGAGKTTIANKFISSQKNQWAHIKHDEIRQLVITGFSSADDSRKNWSAETKNQWQVGIQNCVDLAINFKQSEINCLVDFYSTPSEFETWKNLLNPIDYTLVILLPNKKSVITRNTTRNSPCKLSEGKILECYEDFQGWPHDCSHHTIDNSTLSIEGAVKNISDIIESKNTMSATSVD